MRPTYCIKHTCTHRCLTVTLSAVCLELDHLHNTHHAAAAKQGCVGRFEWVHGAEEERGGGWDSESVGFFLSIAGCRRVWQVCSGVNGFLNIGPSVWLCVNGSSGGVGGCRCLSVVVGLCGRLVCVPIRQGATGASVPPSAAMATARAPCFFFLWGGRTYLTMHRTRQL